MTDHSHDPSADRAKVIPLRAPDASMRAALVHAEANLSAFAGDFDEKSPARATVNTVLLILRSAIAGVTAEAIDDTVMILIDLMKLITEIAEDNAALKELVEEQPEHAEHAAALAELERLRCENDALVKIDRTQLRTLNAALDTSCAALRTTVAKANEGLTIETELARAQAARSAEASRALETTRELIASLEAASKTMAAIKHEPLSAQPLRPAGISLELIEPEIRKRNEWCSELSQLLCELQASKESLDESIGTINDRLARPETTERDRLLAERSKHEQEILRIKQQTRGLVELEGGVKAQLSKLERLKRQITDLEEGTDLVFLKDPLPKLDVLIPTPEPKPAIESSPAVAPACPPSDQLAITAQKHGLTRAALLAVTLLDIASTVVNPRTERMIRGKRLFDLFEAARAAKIIQRFGWRIARVAQDSIDGNSSQRTAFEAFIKYAPHSATIPVLGRNDKPLPWKAQEILSADEVARFSVEIAK